MKGKGPSPNRSSTGEREVLRLCTSPLFMAPWIQQHTFSWPGAKQGAIPIQKLTAESLLTRFTTLCLCPICPIWVGVCVSSAFVLGRCTYLYWLIEWKKLIRATRLLTESTQLQSLYLLPRTGKQLRLLLSIIPPKARHTYKAPVDLKSTKNATGDETITVLANLLESASILL